jgi:hypothetical protein
LILLGKVNFILQANGYYQLACVLTAPFCNFIEQYASVNIEYKVPQTTKHRSLVPRDDKPECLLFATLKQL